MLPTKELSRDPLTSYELDFLSDYVSIVQFRSQKVWSRSVDICGDGKGKLEWSGFHLPPPLPAAEIGLSTVISFVYKDKLWFDESMSVIFCMENT